MKEFALLVVMMVVIQGAVSLGRAFLSAELAARQAEWERPNPRFVSDPKN